MYDHYRIVEDELVPHRSASILQGLRAVGRDKDKGNSIPRIRHLCCKVDKGKQMCKHLLDGMLSVRDEGCRGGLYKVCNARKSYMKKALSFGTFPTAILKPFRAGAHERIFDRERLFWDTTTQANPTPVPSGDNDVHRRIKSRLVITLRPVFPTLPSSSSLFLSKAATSRPGQR